jgi:sulfate adenylyltransferase
VAIGIILSFKFNIGLDMSKLVPPHGSDTINELALSGDALTAELARAQSLPKITCSSREEGDIVMLGVGGFIQLDGFMGNADWEGVCRAEYRS